jgi:hypothetical protein
LTIQLKSELFSAINGKLEEETKTCITEAGLDLKHLIMAQTAKFKEETFEVKKSLIV